MANFPGLLPLAPELVIFYPAMAPFQNIYFNLQA
jgi:hypothetical protein